MRRLSRPGLVSWAAGAALDPVLASHLQEDVSEACALQGLRCMCSLPLGFCTHHYLQEAVSGAKEFCCQEFPGGMCAC